ncbi:hypothetical protein TA5114_03442 [Cognatishimia activa]|uniref:Nucleotidyltransferase n=2 Tax=Cognatishimia activa TaxID=1715691 RepID=A0A0P1J1N5_9RHOB|nr:hypothetical protein TA5113_02580 [Cognatishimia activa]CUK27614.1 hypothetical protein TA5114_03442 [Cognatishimia activa]
MDSLKAIIDAARLNKVSNLISEQSAEQLGLDLRPARGHLDKVKFRTMMLNHSSMVTSFRAHQALAREEIDHVIYKGPFQQAVLYGGPYVKPSADTDLLVSPKDQCRAFSALKQIGFQNKETHAWWWRRFLHEIHLCDDAGTMIDLHHGLGQAGLPNVRKTDAILARSEKCEVAGMAVPALDMVDIPIVAAYSIAKAFLSREPCLGTLLDFKVAMQKLDSKSVDALKARAQAHGLCNIIGFATAVSSATFEGKIDAPGFFGLNPEALASMAVTPWKETLPWPKRRHILRVLSGGNSFHTARDTYWAATAHITRSLLDRNRSAA